MIDHFAPTGATEHDKDLVIPCPAKKCDALAGDECLGLAPGIVHFGRRLKRLLVERGTKLSPKMSG